ncbi:MAG: hypothetical protein AB7F99_00915 [Vicinamibacterales bacterium]
MTAKTRYFVIASLLTTAVGVSAGLLAYYSGLQAPAAAGDRRELRFVPANATLVAFADVRAVMGSELRQEFRRVMPDRPDRGPEEFEEETGINLERDVDHVVAYVAPAETATEDLPGSVLVLARGRFEGSRIEAAMERHGAVREDYRGTALFIGRPERPAGGQRGEREFGLAFVEPELVAVGSPRLVRSALDLREGQGTSIGGNSEIAGLIQTVDGDVWAVGLLDALTDRADLPPAIAERLPPVRQFAASGRINGGLDARLQAEATDEAAANQWRDVVRGIIALARMQSASMPEAQGLLDSIQLGGTDRTITLSFSIPPGIVEWLSRARNPQVQP